MLGVHSPPLRRTRECTNTGHVVLRLRQIQGRACSSPHAAPSQAAFSSFVLSPPTSLLPLLLPYPPPSLHRRLCVDGAMHGGSTPRQGGLPALQQGGAITAVEPAAAATSTDDLPALLLFSAAACVIVWRGWSAPLPLLPLLFTCATWRLAAPASWQRWRAMPVSALRLAIALPSPLLLARITAGATAASPVGAFTLAITLAFGSGTVVLLLVSAVAARARRRRRMLVFSFVA